MDTIAVQNINWIQSFWKTESGLCKSKLPEHFDHRLLKKFQHNEVMFRRFLVEMYEASTAIETQGSFEEEVARNPVPFIACYLYLVKAKKLVPKPKIQPEPIELFQLLH